MFLIWFLFLAGGLVVIVALLLIWFMRLLSGHSGKLGMTFVSTMLSDLVCRLSGEKQRPFFRCGRSYALCLPSTPSVRYGRPACKKLSVGGANKYWERKKPTMQKRGRREGDAEFNSDPPPTILWIENVVVSVHDLSHYSFTACRSLKLPSFWKQKSPIPTSLHPTDI